MFYFDYNSKILTCKVENLCKNATPCGVASLVIYIYYFVPVPPQLLHVTSPAPLQVVHSVEMVPAPPQVLQVSAP
jgi:hypothetical protein